MSHPPPPPFTTSQPPPFPTLAKTCSESNGANLRSSMNAGDSARTSTTGITMASLARSSSSIPHATYKTLQLSLQASNLPQLDLFSPSDAFVVLYEKNNNGLGRHLVSTEQSFIRVGSTEIIMDIASPTWTRPIIFNSTRQEPQQYRLEVYDADEPDVNDLSGQDFIGACEFTLQTFYDLAHDNSGDGSGVSFVNPTFISTQHFELFNKDGKIVQVKHSPAARLTVSLHEKAQNYTKALANIEIKPKKSSDKYLVQFCSLEKLNNSQTTYHKSIQQDREIVVYETPISSNGSFPTFIIDEDSLYQHNIIPPDELDTHSFVVKLIKIKNRMDMKCLGTVRWTLDEKITGATNVTKTFLNPKGEDVGQLIIKNWFSYPTPPSFDDYVEAGLKFRFHYAIDLSGSKGSHHSLHSVNASGKNLYTTAIRDIASGFSQWFEDPSAVSGTKDNEMNGYAFGGLAADAHAVSKTRKFALSPDDTFATFKNIDEICGLYLTHAPYVRESIRYSRFGSLLQSINETIIVTEDIKIDHNDMVVQNMTYHVIIIFSDGCIDDWNDAITALSEMCHKPISVIFVGIGADRTTEFKQLAKFDTYNRNQELLFVENNKVFPYVERNITSAIPYVKAAQSMGHLHEKLVLNLKREVVQHYMTAKKFPPKRV